MYQRLAKTDLALEAVPRRGCRNRSAWQTLSNLITLVQGGPNEMVLGLSGNKAFIREEVRSIQGKAKDGLTGQSVS